MPDDHKRGPLKAIGGNEFRSLLLRVSDTFAEHRDEVDGLNVFPVPDGDTGTNLMLTSRSVLEEIDDSDDIDDDRLPGAVVRAALMSARGNSGVIFSQVLRGLAETLDERGRLDAAGLAVGLGRARGYAYEAVGEPVEGTMLTAIAAAAVAADAAGDAPAGDGGPDLEVLTRHVLDRVRQAVEHTVEQLEVLREAGLVDAGARGFELFCEALHALVTGEPLRRDRDLPEPVVQRRAGPVGRREMGSLEYRFEVQYLLDADDQFATNLRACLAAIGDSVVVVGAGQLINVHVHTNDVGAAIEFGLEFGRPSRILVTYFADQITGRGDAVEQGCGPGGRGGAAEERRAPEGRGAAGQGMRRGPRRGGDVDDGR